MPTDIFLEYLIDSISSMPVYLDENVLTELEDSWRWRHISPGFSTDDDEDEFILDWTKDTLAEPDVLGVVDSEFNQVCVFRLVVLFHVSNVELETRTGNHVKQDRRQHQ